MNGPRLLWRIARRNLTAGFLNVIIGLIIFAGTFVFVAGGSLIGSINRSMRRSIVGSVVGDAQVYSAASRDKPALFDNFNLPDLAPMPDFAKVKAALLGDPDVRAVVPMGDGAAGVVVGNTADEALARLRAAYNARPRDPARIASLKAHVRGIVDVIRADYSKLSVVADASAVDPRAARDLGKAASPRFWAGFDADPFGHLEFLENRVAPLIPDASQIFLHYIGTDLDGFARSFDRLRIVDGTAVPPGHRGMLLSKFVYENMFKLKAAHRLDEIHRALTQQGKRIATDPELKDWVRLNRVGSREILLQLDPLSAARAAAILRRATGSRDTDLRRLLAAFFDTNDANFGARYKVFYGQLAPLLELYRFRPGQTLTISAYTSNGFRREVNVKVYGTYEFKGLERSDLAGSVCLMDLMTFRDLYGYLTPGDRAETRRIEAAAAAQAPPRARAEADLFSGGSVFQSAGRESVDEAARLKALAGRAARARARSRTFTPWQMDHGVALEAAVLYRDPAHLDRQTRRLGLLCRGLGLKALGWRGAAGNIGQFVLAANLILGVATAIIFVVALVIINNAVVMATLQRVREIGTMRALGAQKGFVLGLVLLETVVLGLVFGSAGALAAAGAVRWAAHVGIPATNGYLYFFFSGPRLRPTLSLGSLAASFLVVLLVSCASALYPAVLAARVSPVQAMASED